MSNIDTVKKYATYILCYAWTEAKHPSLMKAKCVTDIKGGWWVHQPVSQRYHNMGRGYGL